MVQKRMYAVTVCFAVALLLATNVSSVWATGSSDKIDASVPTKITADRVIYETKKQSVVFNGSVYVKRSDLEMWADTLTVYFYPAENKGNTSGSDTGNALRGMSAGEPKQLIASGKTVRMKSETRIGTCRRAEYDVDKSLLTMTGDPKLQDGDRTISGETIRYYMAERRSEIVGGAKKRVEAVFGGPSIVKKSGGTR